MTSALEYAFQGVVFFALIGVIWTMRRGEIDKIDQGVQVGTAKIEAAFEKGLTKVEERFNRDIKRLEYEMQKLRDERHKNTQMISVIDGKCVLQADDFKTFKRDIEEDVNSLKQQEFLRSQLHQYRIESDS